MDEETRAILQRLADDASNENASIIRRELRLLLEPVPEPTRTCCDRCKYRDKRGPADTGLGERHVQVFENDRYKHQLWMKCPECNGKGLIE